MHVVHFAVVGAALLTIAGRPHERPRPLPQPAVAQGAVLAGEWRVTWDSDITSSKGAVSRVNKRSVAQLILTQRRDSVEGRWIDGLLNDESTTGPGVPVRGAVHGDTLAISTGRLRTSRGEIRVSMHGVRAQSKLVGTMYVELGNLPPAPRRWEGERTKLP